MRQLNKAIDSLKKNNERLRKQLQTSMNLSLKFTQYIDSSKE